MRTGLLIPVIRALISAKTNVMLVGAPGVGKTEIAKQAANTCEHDFLLYTPITDEPIDIKGLPAMVDGEAKFTPYGRMKLLLEATRPTLALVDDLGQANTSVQASWMQVFLAREISGHKISDHVVFIACTNRKEDGAGVSGVLEPVKSRFHTILHVDPNVDDWIEWALENNVPLDLIAFIKFRPGLLFDFQKTSEIKNSPCPRTVKHVGDLMNLGIPREAELEVYSGAAGEGFATELKAFLEIRRNLPDPKLILDNPSTCDVRVDDPSIAFAMASAVAGIVTEDLMENFCTILDRFVDKGAPEYSAMAMNMAIGRNNELRETHSYISWVSRNGDILIG